MGKPYIELRNIVTMHPEKGSSIRGDLSGGMIRVLGVHQTNEVKATQNLAIIVLFFMICWFPLYTINCIIAFNPDFYVPSTVMLCSIILSHLNSAGNPLLYAYHLKDFRAALKNFFLTLFGRQRCSEPVDKNRLKTSRREATDRGRLVLPQKMAAVVKTSAAVAVATTGEVNRGIWNISEHSLSSSDSLKSVDSVVNQEKCCLMMRPATPYRPRAASDFNPVFKGLAQDDESDDGFNEEETLPYHDYGLDVDCKLEGRLSQAQTTRTVPSGRKRSLSSSSPQISIGVYYVEGDRMTLQAVPPNEGSSRGLDTLLVVDLLRRDRHLNRSLSDSGRPCSGSTLKLKGVVHSFGS